MANKHKGGKHDLFYVSLIVFVIIAAVVVITTSSRGAKPVEAKVQGVNVSRDVSKTELMNMLNEENENAEKVDFLQLKGAASGL